MKIVLRLSLFVLLCAVPLTAQTTFQPGKNVITLRGQAQRLYFFPGAAIASVQTHHRILFAPGDGGWRGFAITMAAQLAAQGNDVYALDTKHYLSSFTHGKSVLTPAAVMSDFHELAARIQSQSSESQPAEKIILVGWSTGAGLTVLAAAHEDKTAYEGLIAVSLGKTNILGWRCRDNLTYLTNQLPNEPTYQTENYLPQVTPLPIFVIQSSNDQFIPNEEAEALFIQTRHPKRFTLIHAHDHSFNGKRAEFFTALQQGLHWIAQHNRHAGKAPQAETIDLVAFPF